MVTLSTFHPFPNSQCNRSSGRAIERVRAILREADLVTITGRTRGDEIDAAGGQLAGKGKDRGSRSRRYAPLRGAITQ